MGNRAVFIRGVASAAPGRTGSSEAVDMHCKLEVLHDKKQKIRIIRVNLRFGEGWESGLEENQNDKKQKIRRIQMNIQFGAGIGGLQPMGFRTTEKSVKSVNILLYFVGSNSGV